jgi:hypothetical protein
MGSASTRKYSALVRYLMARAPPLALDQHLDGAVGKPEELHHRPERADAVDVVLGRIVGLRILLRREEDVLLLVHRLFEAADRLLAARRTAARPCAGRR